MLQDHPVGIRYRLAALWASLTFCYLYGDYFGLYVPGKLRMMTDGLMGPLGETTQGILIGTAAMMAIPSLMVVLSLVLRPGIARILHIVFGLAFTIIMALTMPGGWLFYQLLGVVEMALTLTIAWTAWKWPRAGSGA